MIKNIIIVLIISFSLIIGCKTNEKKEKRNTNISIESHNVYYLVESVNKGDILENKMVMYLPGVFAVYPDNTNNSKEKNYIIGNEINEYIGKKFKKKHLIKDCIMDMYELKKDMFQ